MAVVTSSYRSLNARWLWDLANIKNSLFVGISEISTEQTISVEGKTVTISDLDLNDNDGADAISKCNFFVRAEARFVERSYSNNGDVQLLTRQVYSGTPNRYVSQHDFQDKSQYWYFLTPEQALSNNCYNILLDFMLENQDQTLYPYFRDIRHFYVFDSLKYNGSDITDDFIEKDSDSNFSSGNIIIIDDFVPLTIPDDFNAKIKYLISF